MTIRFKILYKEAETSRKVKCIFKNIYIHEIPLRSMTVAFRHSNRKVYSYMGKYWELHYPKKTKRDIEAFVREANSANLIPADHCIGSEDNLKSVVLQYAERFIIANQRVYRCVSEPMYVVTHDTSTLNVTIMTHDFPPFAFRYDKDHFEDAIAKAKEICSVAYAAPIEPNITKYRIETGDVCKDANKGDSLEIKEDVYEN